MLTKTDKKTLSVVAKSGFTFLGDSHFASYHQAIRCLNRLAAGGLLEKFGSEYRITADGLDALRFGVEG